MIDPSIAEMSRDDAALISRENSYVHYTPALRFGDSLASVERFQGKTWSQIEAEAQQLWEAKHERPWEEFKEVARQAWEEVAAGKTGQKKDDTYEAMFRRHYRRNYADEQYDYSQYAPAYHYGFDIAVDKRLRNKSWEQIEPEAHTYWKRQGLAVPWDDFKEAAHYVWTKIKTSA